GQSPRYPMAVPDRSLDTFVDWRDRRSGAGSHRRYRDRMECRLARSHQSVGHHAGLWIRWICRHFVRTLSGTEGCAARSDCGVALRIADIEEGPRWVKAAIPSSSRRFPLNRPKPTCRRACFLSMIAAASALWGEDGHRPDRERPPRFAGTLPATPRSYRE